MIEVITRKWDYAQSIMIEVITRNYVGLCSKYHDRGHHLVQGIISDYAHAQSIMVDVITRNFDYTQILMIEVIPRN